ncbi:hypothetical protein BKA70DRAFT_1423843 [Coprinopsis sp. MPI-PUGE-AT-0042]|nr:hypothetical protein BKA70DRAFT_1423843 [Coprinopsis sp. MPI-PUGE-AT-0042]
MAAVLSCQDGYISEDEGADENEEEGEGQEEDEDEGGEEVRDIGEEASEDEEYDEGEGEEANVKVEDTEPPVKVEPIEDAVSTPVPPSVALSSSSVAGQIPAQRQSVSPIVSKKRKAVQYEDEEQNASLELPIKRMRAT